MNLGVLPDGKCLNYQECVYAFYLNSEPITLHQVRCMDRKGLIRWNYHEQRDWMWKLDRDALECAAARAVDMDPSKLSLDDQLKLHSKKNDSYLYGKIIDSDLPSEAAAPDEASDIVLKRTSLSVDVPKPVRLVPGGLGGFLYKALGFEKADKQLGYRIVHDAIELQNPNAVDDSEEEEASSEADNGAIVNVIEESAQRTPARNGFESLRSVVSNIPKKKEMVSQSSNRNGNKELHLFS